ncbi:uroporphyrinogen-III synthase [Rhodohalobacter sulfatireducens]|uniref:Uroporphyrinogen-III synthase n=1 Tax=Rhodohalobacter sulfatireducens TaxID=2911366 RepID=A0ABS9KHK7_9BACT|nr:uroporphyrinogen-III synthase [Rhodohalobacter sulfatireducens]MCG2590320.1 uroporphyrinogen-III synthase [Rhodohalobacter sulfatireducens]MDR9364764.1 uroporphyrinogen-III synthase [Balneolaceae bacterium]MDR9409640.1 uroporphyrinogen-III synthase [Balneolaceae bacterium]
MNQLLDIFVTRELDDNQIEQAEDLGLNVVIEPAIEIEFREDWFAIEMLFKSNKEPIIAVTSYNAVKALEFYQSSGKEIPEKATFYAVGKKTAAAVKERLGFDAASPEQQDAIGLAKKIKNDFAKKDDSDKPTVLHFCGDKRRDEFRQFLSDADIHVRDMVVYNTILKSMRLPTHKTDGILFYSPSAVHAFRDSGGFRNKNLPELFAIGETTAEELSIEAGRHVHVSPEPSTEHLLQHVSEVLNREEKKEVLT